MPKHIKKKTKDKPKKKRIKSEDITADDMEIIYEGALETLESKIRQVMIFESSFDNYRERLAKAHDKNKKKRMKALKDLDDKKRLFTTILVPNAELMIDKVRYLLEEKMFTAVSST